MKKAPTQAERILRHLEAGNKLTQVGAFHKFKCWRLASRINELRADGWNIKTKIIKHSGKQYAQYWL